MTRTGAPASDGRHAYAHHDDRPLLDLSAGQVGGRCQLVGDGDDGRLHRGSRGVGLSAQVEQRLDAGRPDRHVHDPVAPRAAERVADDDGRATPSRLRRPSRRRRAEASGSSGQQGGDLSATHVRDVDPAFAHTRPWRVRLMIRPPGPMRTIAADSRSTSSTWRGSFSQRSAQSRASGDGSTVRQLDEAALGLRDDLLGDDEDVVVARVTPATSSARCATRSSPGLDLADALEGDELEA